MHALFHTAKEIKKPNRSTYYDGTYNYWDDSCESLCIWTVDTFQKTDVMQVTAHKNLGFKYSTNGTLHIKRIIKLNTAYNFATDEKGTHPWRV